MKMNTVFIIYNRSTNGFIVDMLDILSLIAILCGILVIINKNPIVSVLFLIGLFASISCYLIMLGLTFIGLSYLIVYIGAISILFLFILMLINIRISELQSSSSNSVLLAISIGISFSYPMYQISPSEVTAINNFIIKNLKQYKLDLSNYALDLSNYALNYVTSNIWDGILIENSHITSIGNIMYTNYNMWLILVSFILLLAMVGVIVITLKPKN